MNLLEKILTVAKENPDTLAVIEREKSYTYKDLMDLADQVAQKIDQKDVFKRPVLVFGEKNFLMLATMLGISLTGRAYIPVDAHTPFERTALITGAAKPSLVIVTVPLEADFADLFQGHLPIENFEGRENFDLDKVDTSQAVSGHDINYLIYTSGTTGVPKGVAVSHDNLVTFTKWMNNDFVKIKNNQILSQVLYSFDLSIFSLYPSLTQGGTLVSLSRDETINFKQLFERLNRDEINTWISTPSFVDICLLDPSFVQERHPNLKQFIFCGEELTHKTATKLVKAFPDAVVYNTYGPTETTGAISSIVVDEELLADYKRVPIGFAKPGVEVKIMDNEIIIVGNSVANGYFENPEKTAQAFFTVDGQPAYHTGDAGFIDEKGVLNYNGRIDFQVKFNGFRIELQDIEAHLLENPTIEKAIVLPQENDDHKVTGLVAALVVDEENPDRAFTKKIREELAKTVMDYMMPTKYVYLKDFPLNQNAKVDRKVLSSEVFGK